MFRDHFQVDLRVDRRARALPDGARGRHRPRAEAQDHRQRVHRGLRGRGQDASSDARVPRPGHALPRRDRERVVQGPERATIKSHHNVGGLPERMKLELVEPLRELFKDEVRAARPRARAAATTCVWRQPFPGPGLAVRCLGEVTRERLRRAARRPTRSSRRRSARPGSTSRSGRRFARAAAGASRSA